MFCHIKRSSVLPVSYFSEIHSVSQLIVVERIFVQLVISTITFFLARCPLARGASKALGFEKF